MSARTHTLMYAEAKESSAVVAKQLVENKDIIRAAVNQIAAYQPRAVVTMARGSSDHAATFAKYLVETQLGLLTASASPSISSIYNVNQQLDKTLYIAVSQSGASPDLLTSVKQAKLAGALTLAFVNVEDSPLSKLVDIVIPLRAGKELSVAATKSYIATLCALVHLVSEWSENHELKMSLQGLPHQLEQSWLFDWSTEGVAALVNARNLFVIGRGLGFGVALEAALKLKETCGLHAEGFSAAEVKHGPMALVGDKFPVLVMAQQDDTLSGIDDLVEEFRKRGSTVLYASESKHANLSVLRGGHPALAPILAIQSFYRLANDLALARGLNPDVPPHLNKVTETL